MIRSGLANLFNVLRIREDNTQLLHKEAAQFISMTTEDPSLRNKFACKLTIVLKH